MTPFLKQMVANQEEHNRENREQLSQPTKGRAIQKRRNPDNPGRDYGRRRGGSPIVFRPQSISKPSREPTVETEEQPDWMKYRDEGSSSGEIKRQRTSASSQGFDSQGHSCARSCFVFDRLGPKVGASKDPEVVDLLEDDGEGGVPPASNASSEKAAQSKLPDLQADEPIPRRQSEVLPQATSPDKPRTPHRRTHSEPSEPPVALKGNGTLLHPWRDSQDKPNNDEPSTSLACREGNANVGKAEGKTWLSWGAEKLPPRTYNLRGRGPSLVKSSASPERHDTLEIGQYLSSLSPHQRRLLEDLQVEYPQGMPGAVLLRFCDLKRLEPSEFLNDNIIEFYIKYFVQELEADEYYKKQLNRCHFFNSYLFEKVNRDPCRGVDDKCPGYASVKTWTKNVNLFAKDFLFFPIHETAHWSLVVVCHPRAAFVKLSKDEAKQKSPCLLHLDSMGGEGHNTEFVCGRIRKYLECEWEDKKRVQFESPDSMRLEPVFYVKRMDVPLQGVSVDCGLFILAYIEYFVHALPPAIHIDTVDKLKDVHSFKYFLSPQWFPRREAFYLRVHLRKLLVTLMFSQYEDQEVRVLVGTLMNLCDTHTYAGPKAVENRNSMIFSKAQRKAPKAEKEKKKKASKKLPDEEDGKQLTMTSYLPTANNKASGGDTTGPIIQRHAVDSSGEEGLKAASPLSPLDHEMSEGNEDNPLSQTMGEAEEQVGGAGGGWVPAIHEKDQKDFIDLLEEEDKMDVVCVQSQDEAIFRQPSQHDSPARDGSPTL